MLLRLRSRDGLERVTVGGGAGAAGAAVTVGDLKAAVHSQLGVPEDEPVALSRDAALLSTKEGGGPDNVELLGPDSAPLSALGVAHGDLLYLLYQSERDVAPTVRKTELDRHPFGAKLTVADIAAKQRRVERQEKAAIESCSFERHAANAFQSYVSNALAFSIKRGGILYGTVDDAANVRVEFVYEPPQRGSATTLALERGTPEEAQVDFLAELMGLKKVGWVFSQANAGERDFIVSADELIAMAAVQGELGDRAVAVVVSFDPGEGGGQVHFEAFQCSAQAVELAREGWFKAEQEDGGAGGRCAMANPKEPSLKEPVIVAGKDAAAVDTDWFLCPVRILDHEGPLLTGTFPIENRITSAQSKADLKAHLARHAALPYEARLADLHLLLWLAKQPNMDPADMLAICEAARARRPLPEGYRVIVDSIAGLA